MPAPSVRRQFLTGADVVNQSALEGGEGGRDGRTLGRQVEVGVQSSMGGQCRGLFDRYRIGCADLNGGIDERGFSCRARVKPRWALT